MLVCLGSYRDTKDWVAYKQQNVYLTVLDAGQSEINVSADSVSGEEMLPDFIQGHLLCVFTRQKGARELSEVSFIRELIPFIKALPS